MKLFINQIGITSLAILLATATCNNSASSENPTSTYDEIMNEDKKASQATPEVSQVAEPSAPYTSNEAVDTVSIETSFGNINVILYNETPLHKTNFLKLCNENYYDGLLFHRVIPNFMIQGGDPNSKTATPGQMLGNGGPNYTIPAEFNPNLKHVKGALAAARTDNPEKASSGSQFYICHVETPFLDGEYTVFGRAISGFDVIDKIANADRDNYDRPLKDIKIIKTTVLTKKDETKSDKKEKKSSKKSKD